MFENKKKTYLLESPHKEKNSLNEAIITFAPAGNILAYISLASHSEYSSNDTRINQCTHVALTRAKDIYKGQRIDGKYLVEFVDGTGAETLLYLKEIENNGSYFSN